MLTLGGLAQLLAQTAAELIPVAEQPPAPVQTGTNAGGIRALPSDAYTVDPAVGVRYRSVFRDTAARPVFRDNGISNLNPLRPIELSPEVHAGSIHGEIQGLAEIPAIGAGFHLLDRGFEPKDADLKVGPIFFKLRALTAGILWSDNINLEERDRDSGTIAMIRLGGTVVAQLTEDFRLALSGGIIYLPFEGKVGIAGLGLQPLSYGLGLEEGAPHLRGQVTWDTHLGGWTIVFADTFSVGISGRASAESRNYLGLFEGFTFDEEDREGRYVFRDRTRQTTESGQSDESHDDNRNDAEIVTYANTVSATGERLYPGPIRIRVRAYHQNLWYNQGNRGLPTMREGATVFARSERPDMRFKPFAFYRVTHNDISPGTSHEFRIGVDGPITDQLFLHADAGYFFRTSTDQSDYLFGLRLTHIAGPYTREAFSIGRDYHEFTDEMETHAAYHISQVLGPRLGADAFAIYAKEEDLLNGEFSRTEWRLGLRLNYSPGPKTTIRLTGIYSEADYDNSPEVNETWTGRLEIGYRFTDTLVSRLLYQYQNRNSSIPGESYYENLVFLTVTKYFE